MHKLNGRRNNNGKSLFERRFGKSPQDFRSIEEVNDFIEKNIGHKLETKLLYPRLVSPTGCILPITNEYNL